MACQLGYLEANLQKKRLSRCNGNMSSGSCGTLALHLVYVREKRHVDVPDLVCSSCPSNNAPGLQHCLLGHVANMLQQVVHQRIHIAKDARNFQLNAANHTAVVALLACAVGCLLFDVALGQEYPLIPDARLGSVYVRVYDSLLLGLFAG